VTLLLDTQALLWWRQGSRKLGPGARAAIEKGADRAAVSVATAWEIAIKVRRGQLTLSHPPHLWMPTAVERGGFTVLDITMAHALTVATLPDHHADPFDRLLIAQAQLEGLTIVTSNAAFDAYSVAVMDARS
jgi:PIN domain nuclease of toxin-antitoxin system